MTKKTLSILLLLIVSSSARLWKLGEIPAGLSLQEVEFGLNLSKIMGSWVLTPFIVRLPFAIVGILSIYLFYLLVFKIQQKFNVAYYASMVLAISPWHIMQSRIFSVGIIIFIALVMLILVLFKRLSNYGQRISKRSLVIAWLLFACSVLLIPDLLRENVNVQRNIAAEKSYYQVVPLFSNKLIESYRYRTGLLLENIDFGNYFFSGHPRERWGVEEVQKLYVALIPLIILGLLKSDKERKIMLYALFSITLVVPVVLQLRGPSITLPIILPILLLSSAGVSFLYQNNIKKRKYILFTISFIFFLESIIFANNYFIDSPDNLFSPRRPIYKELSSEISAYLNSNSTDRVLISEKLDNPLPFMSFYLSTNMLKSVEVKDYSFDDEDSRKTLFVDVLSNIESESWYDEINTIDELYDFGKRHTVAIYTYPK